MRLIILTLLLSLSLFATDKIALVIGNKNYTNQTGLKNPIKDAKLIRDTLHNMDFEVVEAYNTNLNGLGDKLDEFVSKARNAKVAVVYYAGHGIGVGNRNYLIPLGATHLTKSNLSRKLLSVDELKEAVANANGFGVVLFDACRNSFFSGSIAGLSSGRASRALVQPTVTRANVLVSFSTQAGTKAEDDVNGGEHSPYAIALSENLKNNRDIRLVMGSIRTRVYGLTANQQYPIEKNMLDGKNYCLSGFCQQKVVIDNSENEKLKAEIARLKKQQSSYVSSRVVPQADRVVALEPKPVPVVSTSKWLKPSDGVCKANGGKLYKGVCQANWENAKKICSVSGGQLPSRADLKKVVVDCGGSFTTYGNRDWDSLIDKNIANKSYQACYKEKGFIGWYWTREEKNSSYAWYVSFNLGLDGWDGKSVNGYALCVR